MLFPALEMSRPMPDMVLQAETAMAPNTSKTRTSLENERALMLISPMKVPRNRGAIVRQAGGLVEVGGRVRRYFARVSVTVIILTRFLPSNASYMSMTCLSGPSRFTTIFHGRPCGVIVSFMIPS
jgi:hypothetical protein